MTGSAAPETWLLLFTRPPLTLPENPGTSPEPFHPAHLPQPPVQPVLNVPHGHVHRACSVPYPHPVLPASLVHRLR